MYLHFLIVILHYFANHLKSFKDAKETEKLNHKQGTEMVSMVILNKTVRDSSVALFCNIINISLSLVHNLIHLFSSSVLLH